jgi:hypothetical protein
MKARKIRISNIAKKAVIMIRISCLMETFSN